MSRGDPTYWRVSPNFWRHAAEHDWSEDVRALAMYLLTNPHRKTEGLYWLPIGYMASDLAWLTERVAESLAILEAEGFVAYDHKASVVFLPKALKYQRPDNPNQWTAAIRSIRELPANGLFPAFLEAACAYAKGFAKALREAFPKESAQGYTDPPAPTPAPTLSRRRTTEVGATDKTPLDSHADRGVVDKSCIAEAPPPESKGKDHKVGTSMTGERKVLAGGEQSPPAPRARPSARPGTCDGGEPCPALKLRGIRSLVERIVPGQSGRIWSNETDLGRSMAKLAAYLCGEAQGILPSLERAEREASCEQLLRSALERAATQHAKSPIRSLPAYINGMIAKQCLGDVVGDELVEQLRRDASRSYEGNGKRAAEPISLGVALARRKGLGASG
jgi:hypothetical protein